MYVYTYIYSKRTTTKQHFDALSHQTKKIKVDSLYFDFCALCCCSCVKS